MKSIIIDGLLILVLLVSITLNSYQIFTDVIVPVTIDKAQIINPALLPGENLIITAQVNRIRHCETISHSFIKDEEGNIVLQELVPFAGNKMGNQQIRLLVKLPNDIKPGVYTYEPIAYTDCGTHVHVATYTDKILSFRIVDKNWNGYDNQKTKTNNQ